MPESHKLVLILTNQDRKHNSQCSN